MQTRLWLATAATVALAAAGLTVAGTTPLHGQAPRAGAPDTPPNHHTLAREIDRAVQDALTQAGVRHGELRADLARTVDEATRTAQDAVRDLDVDAVVEEAMQGLPDLAMPGGRPRIGVSTRDVTADEAKTAGLTGITGALVSDVAADSAAGKAGLLAGDIIVTVDGETIRSARQLARVIAESPDGRPLAIAYVRGTTTQTVTVTPDARTPKVMTFERAPLAPRREGSVERRTMPGDNARAFSFRQGPDVRWRVGRGRLGIMVQPLTDQLATFFGVKGGVLVTQVTAASAAATAGITAGDVITEVNGKPVRDSGDVLSHLEGLEDGAVVPVSLVRDRKARAVSVTLVAPAATSGSRPAVRRVRFTA